MPSITTQIPHQVHIAVARQARLPEMDYPPVQGYRFSAAAFAAGIENHSVDDTPVRIYNPEKTRADCFKFLALEALPTEGVDI